MVRRRRGRIGIVSSLVGEGPTPTVAVYGATKAFLTNFAQALQVCTLRARTVNNDRLFAQHELLPKGVGVTVVVPGAILTEFATRANASNALVFRVPGGAMSSAAVASSTVRGLLRAKPYIVPGLVNKYSIFVCVSVSLKCA
jgi:short-subunit dehydrogenase